MKITQITAKNPLTPSKLADFAINPYVGCAFACRYCYACYTKNIAHENEKWGEFMDAKFYSQPIDLAKIAGKSIIISPISDCYNPLEAKLKITQNIITQLIHANCSEVRLITKSKLILRDIKLLKQVKNLCVAVSLNTLDQGFASAMDRANSVSERLETLKILHTNNIKTVLFVSPIFIGITDVFALILKTREFVDEIWLEALNLRYPYKSDILNFIAQNYTHLKSLYEQIYVKFDTSPLHKLRDQCVKFCENLGVSYKDFMVREARFTSKNDKILKDKKPTKAHKFIQKSLFD